MRFVVILGCAGLLLVGCAAAPPPPPVAMPTTLEGKAAARACLQTHQTCVLPCQFMGWAHRAGCFSRCETEKRTCFALAE